MNYFIRSGAAPKEPSGCIIAGVFEKRALSGAAQALDRSSGGAIAKALARGDLAGKPGQSLMLHDLPHLSCDRVLLVGLGPEKKFDDGAYRKACATAARVLRGAGASDAVSYLTHLTVAARDARWNVAQALLATQDELYRFDSCRGSEARDELPTVALTRLTFDLPRSKDQPLGETGLAQALAISAGVTLTKNLGNTPPNICTPTFLAQQAQQLTREHQSITTRVLEQNDMEQLGMGALLAVARGSRQPPKLILLEYLQGKQGDQPVALVGKGITFDSGGISIKPSDKMDEMKFDMCGGASVLGAFKAVAELKLPINLIGAVPACENMPGGLAAKPGDIVTSMAGITIEILNTDAEGRLILCDALTYVEKNYQPEVCVDIATLTGACVVALGGHASGLFSNTASLATALLEAGESTGDRAWQLPLWEDYQSALKSEHADVGNISGGRDAGAITAASFLHRFTRKMQWAHLDVAGSAWKGKAATGRPVPLLVQYLISYAAK